jgi:hypothetical protein
VSSQETEQQRAARAYAAGRGQREGARTGGDNARIDGVNTAGARVGGAR